jgi:hypothetical protein
MHGDESDRSQFPGGEGGFEAAEAERAARTLQRKADRLCSLIVASDYPDVDIDVEIAALRRWCRRWLPDRTELFELVYVSRFERLREQFRTPHG